MQRSVDRNERLCNIVPTRPRPSYPLKPILQYCQYSMTCHNILRNVTWPRRPCSWIKGMQRSVDREERSCNIVPNIVIDGDGWRWMMVDENGCKSNILRNVTGPKRPCSWIKGMQRIVDREERSCNALQYRSQETKTILSSNISMVGNHVNSMQGPAILSSGWPCT